ncbi:hypothetical protein DL897_15365 [Thermoflavimicrobium daqui]|jgi:asparagine synthase (glutamine-hydrolysing)|uniref:Asparagine synthetase domain-containing protein n=1 Tax=Thermoflavimicrobium daqui TaxID=2137476 RepID=A0A364K1Q9_9BACL|nr:hypothetical protein DL897_15365 [Thermoflavimicrobium daqui]
MGWSSLPSNAIWYTEEAKYKAGELLIQYSNEAEPFSYKAGQHQSMVDINLIGRTSRIEKQIADRIGINLHFPYLDHHIIQTCMSTNMEERMSPYEFKPLLKKAFNRELPKKLLERTTKGDYTYDLFFGMKKNVHQILELLQTSHLAEQEKGPHSLRPVNSYRKYVEDYG